MRIRHILGALLVLQLIALTAFPIFSDEAIYIRWAKLAVSEPIKYAFLPMLDGKPPLHVWAIIPFVQVFGDPLFGARLFSVLVGCITAVGMLKLAELVGGNRKQQVLALVLTLITPYWLFHHRTAVAEGFLVFWLVLAMVSGLRLLRSPTFAWKHFVVFAIAVAGALWTKTTALFFIPMLGLLPALAWSVEKEKRSLFSVYLNKKTYLLAAAGFMGCLGFLALRLSPLFPFLFSRSADYAFTAQELLAGEWKYVLFASLPKIMWWITWYMSPFLVLVMLRPEKRTRILWLMAVVYAAPIILTGRVVTARYIFPVAVPLTIAAALGLGAMLEKGSKILGRVALWGFILHASVFGFLLFALPDYSLLTREDKHQYLLEWSSGHGIAQIVERVKGDLKFHPVIVATEGYFGTLPDGIWIYFANYKGPNSVEVYGIGQPISEIPVSLQQRVVNDTIVYLVVNQSRFSDTNTDKYEIVGTYPRPYGAPPLLLLKVNKVKTQ